MMAHHKRHPITYRARLGATRQGILVAAEVDVLADGGAYSSTSIPVLANAMLFSTGPYRIPNVCVSGKVVYTHNLPCGAMRGFGALQGNFCAEMQMTHLADALGMDPVELRARNLVTQDDSLPNGARLPEGAMAAELCLQEAASASGWKRIESPHTGTWHAPVRREAPGSRRVHGIGFACGWKNVGLGAGVPDAAETVIELYGGAQIENVLIRNASADVGQGVQTVMAQIAASVLQVRIEQIHFAGSDTLNSPPSGTSSASRLTLMVGNSVLLAAQDALRAWRDREERPAIGRGVYEAFPTHPQHATPPGELTHYSLGYTAGCAKVEVDLDTGQVTLLSYTSALDAGKAINPCQVEGQTHGGLTQAIGWTLTENLVQREGRLLSNDLTTYLIPTSVDIPKRIKVILLETADPMGPFGARGIGELPMLTVAPAILAAIRDACGAWLDQVPALAEDVWRKLSAMKP